MAQSSLAGLGVSARYSRFDGEARYALASGAHAYQFALRGGGSFGSEQLPAYALFQLGGLLSMSGYRQQKLLGPRHVYGRLSHQTRPAQVPLFAAICGGLAYEAVDMPQSVSINDQGLLQSGTAYLAADMPLGTVFVGFGYASTANKAVCIDLGKPF